MWLGLSLFKLQFRPLPHKPNSFRFFLAFGNSGWTESKELPRRHGLTTFCLRTDSLYYLSPLLEFLLFLNTISFLAGFKVKDYRNIKLKEKATKEKKKKRLLLSNNRKKLRIEENHPIVPCSLLTKSSKTKDEDGGFSHHDRDEESQNEGF